jgi:prepilin peptidase CpaA
MNLTGMAPQWLLFVLVGLLLLAAIEDVIRLRISNLTCLAILAAGLVVLLLVGPEITVWQNIVVFVGLLIIGTPLFAAGKMGGGDIKLLAVTGLWFDLLGALLMIASVLIAGGILALILIGLRRLKWSVQAKEKSKVLKRGGVIPYGVAISAGAIFSILRVTAWA